MKTLIAAGLTLAAVSVWGGIPLNQIKAELKASPVSELGATAAGLITKADPTAREVVTCQAVNAAIDLRPTATVLVVGAVAQAVPQMAASAASTAAARRPELTAAITQAAVERAPAQVVAIVTAVSKRVPAKQKAVALAAAQAVPGIDPQALATVVASLKTDAAEAAPPGPPTPTGAPYTPYGGIPREILAGGHSGPRAYSGP